MVGETQVPMLPWWRGFSVSSTDVRRQIIRCVANLPCDSQGEVKKVGEHKYETYGCGEKINDTTIMITELPIHKWTTSFKAELEALCGEKGDGVIKVSC